jgi:hypothetical protein
LRFSNLSLRENLLPQAKRTISILQGTNNMIPHKQNTIHWNFFIALENDLSFLSRFLEITTSNFSSYSVELGRILFAAASEVDIVSKMYCQKIENINVAENIGNYKAIITKHHPEFHAIKVHMPMHGITLNPWNKWRSEIQPHWWRAYNKAKHERHEHFSEANLKNAINAVAALYILLIFFYEKEIKSGVLVLNSQLFFIED